MTTAPVARFPASTGPRALGKLLPGAAGAFAVASLGGALVGFGGEARIGGVGPCLYLLLVSLGSLWLLWKVLRTVWMTTIDGNGTIVCLANRGRWEVAHGDVVAVRTDVYGFFLVLVTRRRRKIWLWAHVQDSSAFIRAIRTWNPGVAVDDRIAHGLERPSPGR